MKKILLCFFLSIQINQSVETQIYLFLQQFKRVTDIVFYIFFSLQYYHLRKSSIVSYSRRNIHFFIFVNDYFVKTVWKRLNKPLLFKSWELQNIVYLSAEKILVFVLLFTQNLKIAFCVESFAVNLKGFEVLELILHNIVFIRFYFLFIQLFWL